MELSGSRAGATPAPHAPGPGSPPHTPGPGSPRHAGAGVALFRLIRHWARRAPQRIALDATGSARDVPRILVIDSISAAVDRAGPAAAVDVRAVAQALGVDRSVASRMVSDAVQAGLVERGVAAHDGRHAALALTPAGKELVAAARQWQDSVFEAFTEGWGDEERKVFARLLIRFCAAATAH